MSPKSKKRPKQAAEAAPAPIVVEETQPTTLLPVDLMKIKELLEEQFGHARKMAAADAKGTSMFFLARGDYVGMFVVRNGEEVKERLYLCKILTVTDNPKVDS
jgi:hypothetical protein